MDWIWDPQIWIALTSLTVLELVLGIDNVVFISILASKLEKERQDQARKIGLMLAMLMRIVLLLSLAWIMRLSTPLVTILGTELSGRDLILIVGGLFLLAKSTHEIHQKLEGTQAHLSREAAPSFRAVLVQIVLLDAVFSLDSVITAVGMVEQVPIMVAAIVIAIVVMMVFAKPVSEFVDRHPTVKMLALSFLLMIGLALITDGLGHHIPRGYIYFAFGFSVFVEFLNLRLASRAKTPVRLHEQYVWEGPASD